jgi:hypothetical protein
MRELELVGPSEPCFEAACKKFSDLFQGPLGAKSIAALRAATRLGDGEVTRVASALATDEVAA